MHEGGACFADLSGEGFGSGLGGISMRLGMGVGWGFGFFKPQDHIILNSCETCKICSS